MEIKTGIETWPNGKLKSRTRYYIDSTGRKIWHGFIESWYENGQKNSESKWQDGRIHGTSITWREDGTVVGIGSYKGGYTKPHGVKKNWWRNCQLQSELIYEDGKIIEGSSYSVTGEEISCIKNGTGIFLSHHENGKISVETEYKNSRMIKDITWYDNGQMAVESFYGDDGLLQASVSYDPNGNKVGEVINGNGKRVLYHPSEPYGNMPWATMIYEDGKEAYPPDFNL